MNPILKGFLSLVLLLIVSCTCLAQQILNKPVVLSVKAQPVSQVLKSVGEQGNFYFSYNSNIIPGDSLVSIAFRGSVSGLLEKLFKSKYHFKEKGDYLIILPAPRENSAHISGYIIDQDNHAPVDFASVYSRQLLISTLSEDNGHFRLRIKDQSFPIRLVVSKVGYADTTITIESREKSDVKILISQRAVDLDPLTVRYSEGEGTWLGRLFLSAKTRMQSRNIGRFFVSLPYQASLTPGLGTHGKMSGQVVNKVSLNFLGGYTAGVNGVEMAGGFNISKQDVRFVQLAGAFNIVSGKVYGVQIAGLHNHALDSLRGLQISGVTSIAGKIVRGVQVGGAMSRAEKFKGVQVGGAFSVANQKSGGGQISGAYNHVGGSFRGFQVAGAGNFVRDTLNGIQVTAGANIARTQSGTQLGVVNFAKTLKGFQLGIINIADSSSGFSLGLFNVIARSTSNVSVFASEVAPVNIAWKTGTNHFYTILSAGTSVNRSSKAYLLTLGFGSEFFPFRKAGFFTELTNTNIFLGSWERMPSLYRFQLAATWKPVRRLMLFAGPALVVHQAGEGEADSGYKRFPLAGYPNFGIGSNLTGWIGWQAGVSWRYGKF